MNECKHSRFTPKVSVTILGDGRYQLRVKIQCAECKTDFKFFGVPKGHDLNGCVASSDRIELRAAIGTDDTLLEYYKRSTGIDVAAALLVQKMMNEEIVIDAEMEHSETNQ